MVLVPITVKSQIQKSILDSGLVWHYSTAVAHSPTNFDVWPFRYSISQSDTLIDSLIFHKIIGRSSLISEDTVNGKVWLYSIPDNQKYLILDFEAEIGDTLMLNFEGSFYDYAIISDSLTNITLLNGDNRIAKAFNVYKNGQLEMQFKWIDGIVSDGGIAYYEVYDGLAVTLLRCITEYENGHVTLIGDCTVGLNEISQESFKILPNPAHSTFQIESDLRIEELNIFDIQGKLISNRLVQKVYDISMLQTGFYILRFRTDQGVVFRKLIKE